MRHINGWVRSKEFEKTCRTCFHCPYDKQIEMSTGSRKSYPFDHTDDVKGKSELLPINHNSACDII